MDSRLLEKLFSPTGHWQGSCVIYVNAATSVSTSGPDSIVSGGTKSYSPRITSGRVQAEAVCYRPQDGAVFAVQRARARQSTGEEFDVQTLIVIDETHVVGVEFDGLNRLASLGMQPPPAPDKPHYSAGTLVG